MLSLRFMLLSMADTTNSGGRPTDCSGLDPAAEAPAIVSDGQGHRHQIALGRSSTLRRTKRRSLKKPSAEHSQAMKCLSLPAVTATGVHAACVTTIAELMAEMEASRDNVQTQLTSLSNLERIIESNVVQREAACQRGIIVPVLYALNRYQNNHRVATTGCWVLANLAMDSAVNNAIVKSGGVTLITKVMKLHSPSTNLLHAGCAALCNLATREKSQYQLYDDGAVQAMVKAMRACPQSEWIQYTSIQAIQNLCDTESLCLGMLQKGVVEAILAAMTCMNDHDDLLQSACWSLSSLAFAVNDTSRMSMCRAGAIEGVVAALEACPGHQGVQFTGCSALSNLARTEQALPEMLELKAIPALIYAISSSSSHLGILAYAYRTLVLLAAYEPAQQEMLLSDIPSLCERTLDSVREGPAYVESKELRRRLRSSRPRTRCIVL